MRSRVKIRNLFILYEKDIQNDMCLKLYTCFSQNSKTNDSLQLPVGDYKLNDLSRYQQRFTKRWRLILVGLIFTVISCTQFDIIS